MDNVIVITKKRVGVIPSDVGVTNRVRGDNITRASALIVKH